MDKDSSLGEKIRTLFREQGITIASILTAIGMAIGVLVEALLPGGGGGAAASGGGEPPPKDEGGLKERIRSKLKALASLPGKLGVKAAEALPGIIGQGGHKPGNHGKPGKLREFEKLSKISGKTQGNLNFCRKT